MTEKTYNPSDYGRKEENLVKLFISQKDDAKLYFENIIKPRLDRSYKLYIADNSDRSKEIKKWQANVSVPYAQAVVETLKPRILDARPEFNVQGRNEDDQKKASRLQSLSDYTWEVSEAEKTAELVVSSSLIYGTSYMQVSWKKDVRTLEFLKTKDIDSKKKFDWVKEKRTFYDAPYLEWVDNYSLWYDWHNVEADSKQYWFKRLLLTETEIKRKYPMADKKRLTKAFNCTGDLTDYASIRNEVKFSHEKITKGADYGQSGSGLAGGADIYKSSENKMHEVFEWLRPFDDKFAIIVNDVPILKGGDMPNPYDFKESFFIEVPYLKIPGEFEGYGIPLILENPQIMLNMVKNQRLDAMTLNIHKMWIVNPLANINKEELIARPFGIVYSTDPGGAREVQMSDIKPSAYREEELLKSDMRYSSGVDDASMGAGGGASSATEVRHLRESTLERVRLFVNHLGYAYSRVMRYWISMYKQFYTEKMIIRITGDNGENVFPIIEKDDLMGEFDFRATVLPAIAGQNDVKKKQDMDLFQLLITLPFIDPEKLVSKMLHDWSWNLESLKKGGEQQAQAVDGQQLPGQGEPQPQGDSGQPQPPQGDGQPQGELIPSGQGSGITSGQIPENVAKQVLAMLSGGGEGASYGGGQSPFSELSSPVNLLKNKTVPPTPKAIQPTTNPRGMNRGGKGGGKVNAVNTNIPLKQTSSVESNLVNRALSIQR